MPALLFAETNMCSSSKDDTLILGRKLAWQEIHAPDDAEGDLSMTSTYSTELLSLGGAVDIDAVSTIPDMIDGEAIGLTLFIDHREDTVLALTE